MLSQPDPSPLGSSGAATAERSRKHTADDLLFAIVPQQWNYAVTLKKAKCCSESQLKLLSCFLTFEPFLIIFITAVKDCAQLLILYLFLHEKHIHLLSKGLGHLLQ